MEQPDVPSNGMPVEPDILPEHAEFGLLQKIDPATGNATTVFPACALENGQIGKCLYCTTSNGRFFRTSVIRELRRTEEGYEILTKSGSIYRFTRTECQPRASSCSLMERFRLGIMRFLCPRGKTT